MRLKDIKDLPTLPLVASKAMAIAEDPRSSARDLLRVIMSDPPLAARVLRVANSAYFRRGRAISDLQTAIVHLGFPHVRNLIIGVSVINSLDPLFVGTRYRREEFWLHSISVGALSKQIAEVRKGFAPSVAFVAGLLHDIGKLVLDRFFHDDFERTLNVAEGENIAFIDAERKTFSTNHATIAGDLLELWGLPKNLSDPIRWHHAPELCVEKHRPTAVVVQIADYLCNVHQLGYSGNPNPTPLPPNSLDLIGSTDVDLKAMIDTLAKEPLSLG